MPNELHYCFALAVLYPVKTNEYASFTSFITAYRRFYFISLELLNKLLHIDKDELSWTELCYKCVRRYSAYRVIC